MAFIKKRREQDRNQRKIKKEEKIEQKLRDLKEDSTVGREYNCK